MANGGFELPAVEGNGAFVADLSCWDLTDSDEAEILTMGSWMAAEGEQSIDLNPNGQAEISQLMPTEVGSSYKLSFKLSGSLFGPAQDYKVEVYWAGESMGIFSFNTTGISAHNMGWQTIEVELPAAVTDLTELRFASRTTGAFGVALDDVRVGPLN